MATTNRNSPPITVVTTGQRPRTRQPLSAHAQPHFNAATMGSATNVIMNRPSPPKHKSTPQPSLVSVHHFQQQVQQQQNQQQQSQQLQQAHQQQQQHQQQSNTAAGQEDEGELHPPVDAALLSALRDQRERVALLRLEQKLVEFTNDPTLIYVDVGPGGGTGNNADNNGGGQTNHHAGGEDEAHNGHASPPATAINRELLHMNLRTSFHRKCLHKLADRFRITRETVAENNAIRLIKGTDSRVPNKLLFDLVKQINSNAQPTTIMNGNNAVDGQGITGMGTRYGKRSVMAQGGGPLSTANMHPVAQAPQDRIADNANNGIVSATENMASIQLTSDKGGSSGATREKKKNKKKEKIKIFQRAGGQKGSTGNLRLNASGGDPNSLKSNMRKKNLSDKEKYYAEVRARIFNSSSENNATATKTNTNTIVHTNNTEEPPSTDLGTTNCNPSRTTPSGLQDTYTPCPTTKYPAPSELRTGTNTSPVPEAPHPTPSSFTTAEPSSLYYPPANDPSMTEPARVNTPPGSHRSSNNAAPAAVTSGAMSKVTWRNRQQEASDPDFQRGMHVVPMNVVPPPVSYHYQNQYHNQCGGMPGVNSGMGHNMINGYHYNTGGVQAGAPGNTGVGGGMLELGGYHISESSTSWQRQDVSGGCGVTANSMHQPQQIPPVIYSSPTPGQYQVLTQQQQHQYSSSPIGLQLGAGGGGSGSVSIATNQQRHGNVNMHREESVDSGSRLVYTAEDFPALG